MIVPSARMIALAPAFRRRRGDSSHDRRQHEGFTGVLELGNLFENIGFLSHRQSSLTVRSAAAQAPPDHSSVFAAAK
jgi:hypothetical protein